MQSQNTSLRTNEASAASASRRSRHSLSKKDVLISTPKSYPMNLTADGNLKLNRGGNSMGLGRKTPKKRAHVSFSKDTSCNERRADVTDEHRKSLLGYDWIAGILDNTSYLSDKPDGFFENLKEFRRVNREDCYGRPIEKPSSLQITPHRRHEDIENDANTISCENTYTLNERLFPVAIHGPDTPCAVCKTKREPEYESEGSYVRVSVPRSSLQSPYKLRPHRRSSFEPTDTVGLSAHCLAGWESSKPAVIPAPASLDLKASMSHPNALNAVRTYQSQNTSDLLDRSLSMSYSVQLLERQRRSVGQLGQSSPYMHGSVRRDTTS